MKRILLLVSSLLIVTPALAHSKEAVPDDVFARIGDVVLTQEMLDAAFSRIPEEHRLNFIRDSKKVDQLVKQILTNMILSSEAREAGFDQQPEVAGRIQLAENKALTEAWLDERVRQAPKPDYEALAREFYLLNPERFMSELTLDLTHLLIKAEERSEEEAKAIAEDLRLQALDNPSSFDRLVRDHSEASGVARNGGRLPGVKINQMVESFEKAALALEKPGDISGVVQTSFGFHVIRLDDRHEPEKIPFEQVRDSLVAAQQRDYQEKTRTRIVTEAVSVAPLEFPDGAIDKMLRRHFGENLENAPEYQR